MATSNYLQPILYRLMRWTTARCHVSMSRIMQNGLTHRTSWLPTTAAHFLRIQKFSSLHLAYCMDVSWSYSAAELAKGFCNMIRSSCKTIVSRSRCQSDDVYRTPLTLLFRGSLTHQATTTKYSTTSTQSIVWVQWWYSREPVHADMGNRRATPAM